MFMIQAGSVDILRPSCTPYPVEVGMMAEMGIVMITRAPLPHPLEEISTIHTVVSSRYIPNVSSKFLE